MFTQAIGAAISIRVGQAIAAHHLGHLGCILIQRDSGDGKIGRVNDRGDLTEHKHSRRDQRNCALSASATWIMRAHAGLIPANS